MFSILELCIIFSLFIPLIIIGIYSNSFLLYLIFKNVSSQSSLNLLSLPFFFTGLFSSLILLPLVIVNIFYPSSLLCYITGITHYAFQSICLLTILCLILLRSIYIFFPSFLTKFSSQRMTFICMAIIFLLSSVLTIIIFQVEFFPNLFPACQMVEIPPSALRLSLYFGIGVFLSLFLWAINAMMDVLTGRKNVKISG